MHTILPQVASVVVLEEIEMEKMKAKKQTAKWNADFVRSFYSLHPYYVAGQRGLR